MICGESYDEEWLQCTFVISGLMKTAQTQKDTFFFLYKCDIFKAKINVELLCYLKEYRVQYTRHIASCCENRLVFALLFPYHKIKL
jgi:hypothetical protein